ncbi:MAG: DUF4912 domain-containing protein [Candidatus Omnitrophota bacterium]|nr:MAG: DUF4912 domain-containing protein [Candidatus Omnitrophota bacterium]
MKRAPSKTFKKKGAARKKVSAKRSIHLPGKKKSTTKRVSSKKSTLSRQPISLQSEKEFVEQAKFTTVQQRVIEQPVPQVTSCSLPVRYGDNRIMLLPRDPWWLHTYWDISEERINEVISSMPVHERQNLRWAVRVYDVSSVQDFRGDNANCFFDIDIYFDAGNWYINVNQPGRAWCVEIGLKSPQGTFFVIARSNIIRTPCFGISDQIDEEWVLPDEEYFKILGIYDLGKSSLERKRKFEEIFKQQISSPLASWGVSSLFSERAPAKDKFLLEIWTELILYGRTEPDATVTVEGKEVHLRKDGTFSLRYALPPGEFTFEAVATSKNKKQRKRQVPAVKRYNK